MIGGRNTTPHVLYDSSACMGLSMNATWLHNIPFTTNAGRRLSVPCPLIRSSAALPQSRGRLPADMVKCAPQDLQAAVVFRGANPFPSPDVSPQSASQGGAPRIPCILGNGNPSEGGGYWDSGGGQQMSRSLSQRVHSYFDLAALGSSGQDFSQGLSQGIGGIPSPSGQPQRWAPPPPRIGGLSAAEELAAIMRRPEPDEALAVAAAVHTLNPGYGAPSAGSFLGRGSSILPPTVPAVSPSGAQGGALSPASSSAMWASMDSEDVSTWIHAGRDSTFSGGSFGRPPPEVSKFIPQSPPSSVSSPPHSSASSPLPLRLSPFLLHTHPPAYQNTLQHYYQWTQLTQMDLAGCITLPSSPPLL